MKKSIGITLKIFALSSSILLLLLAIALHTHNKIESINQEINTLAEIIFPAVQQVDEASIAMLEQEVHFERILKLFEFRAEQTETINHEIKAFRQWGKQAGKKLALVEQLISSPTSNIVSQQSSLLMEDIGQLQSILPMLQQITDKHQHFQHYAQEVFLRFSAGDDVVSFHEDERNLEKEEDEINQDIEQTLAFLQNFTINAAQKANEHQEAVLINSVLLVLAAIILGLAYAGILSQQITAPLKRLTTEVDKVLSEQSLSPIEVKTRDEVGELTKRFNQTLTKLRHSEKLKDLFGKYLDPRLISDMETQNKSFNLDGEKQMVTVLLSQLDGLQIKGSEVQPEVLVSLINEYLEIQLDSASSHKGMQNFVLTEILTFWSHPFSNKTRHNQLACETLLQQSKNLPEFKEKLSSRFPQIQKADHITLRAGISSGALVVGNLGPAGARSYTVIGDEVNAASRLKGVARFFDIQAVLTATVAKSVQSHFLVRPLGQVKVTGKDDALEIFELVAKQSDAELPQWLTAFERGFQYFQQQKFSSATQHFKQVLAYTPQDNVTLKFIEACHHYLENPPLAQWQHIWVMEQK